MVTIGPMQGWDQVVPLQRPGLSQGKGTYALAYLPQKSLPWFVTDCSDPISVLC